MRGVPTGFWHQGEVDFFWDIGAHEFEASGSNVPTEFDIVGAEYYAVAPPGYAYSGPQTAEYSTRKYNTLSAAEAALPATATTPLVINIIGDWTGETDTTAITVSGVTTSASNYVLIRAIGVARHAGVWSLSKYRLYVSNATAILIATNFCRIDGLLIGKSSSSAHYQTGIRMDTLSVSNDIRISNCVVRQAGNNSYAESGILVNNVNAIVAIWNCICYGTSTQGLNGNAGIAALTANTIKVYSSTLVGWNGLYNEGAGPVTVKNCYGAAIPGGLKGFEGVGITKTTCASSDADSGNVGLTSIPHSTANFENVTLATADYRLKEGSILIQAGTVTSGDAAPLNFATDISGKARP